MRNKLIVFVVCVGVFLFPLLGQTSSNERNRLTGCEENEARLDKISLSFSEKSGPENVLIIIARQGDGESSKQINLHRLHNAKEYILYRVPAIQRNRVVVAEGEKVAGLGKVEFYLNGKLIDFLLVAKNRPLCVDCCENNRIPAFSPKKNT